MNRTVNANTKSQMVRQILAEIGAVSESPPKGWRASVEEKLAKMKKNGVPIKVHPMTIYQIRHREMEKKFPSSKKKKLRSSTKKSASSRRFNKEMQKLDDYFKVLKFARSYGGIEKMQEALDFLKRLT
jgi:hypothetical protein